MTVRVIEAVTVSDLTQRTVFALKIRARISKNDAVERFTKQYGLDVFQGHAEFVDAHRIRVGSEILEFSRAVVCTGAKPVIPNIAGLRSVNYLTNESIFNLTELPQRLAVIGAGPVGIEMAQAFACFGSKVVVFEANERIMSNEERESTDIIQNKLHRLFGVEFYFNCKIHRISERTADSDSCSDSEDEDDGDENHGMSRKSVVITIGGRPNLLRSLLMLAVEVVDGA
jgi:pyruvate/2-oxoglutarate dehydrogenase complex dihydrolipoamide dehydrogenase (E3) component